MKRVLLMILFFMASFSIQLSAQDTIVFIDNTEVFAKVLEIGKTIKYKKHSNLNGPTYIAEQYEIYSILYRNGEKDFFNSERDVYVEKDPVIIIENKINYNDDGINENYLYLGYNGFSKEYYEGYNLLSEEAFFKKLREDKEVLEAYNAGRNIKTNGGILMCIGGGVMMAGIIKKVAFITANLDRPTTIQSERKHVGTGTLLIGGVLGIIGGRVANKGQSKQINALNQYNSKVPEKMGIGFTENGIGLLVQF